MQRLLYFTAASVCALTLATVATGARTATPGVTATEVVIGGTIPITGVASAYRTVGYGAAAYFRYVNAHGGVNKRKIHYIIKDDQYDPGQTMDKTRELVEQDHVFAIFNSLGTEHNLATRPYLNAIKVPKLYVNAVSSASNVMGIATVGTSKKQTDGTISIVFLKDPTDPRWARDRGIKLYRTIMKRFKGTNPSDVYNVYGMSVAHTFVEA